jgi:hypothetical protein
LIGWGVDAISGAQWNLTPKTINVKLKEITPAAQITPVAKSSAAIFIEELRNLDQLHVDKKITDEEYAKMRTSLVEKYSKN